MLEAYEEEGQPDAPCDIELAQERGISEAVLARYEALKGKP